MKAYLLILTRSIIIIINKINKVKNIEYSVSPHPRNTTKKTSIDLSQIAGKPPTLNFSTKSKKNDVIPTQLGI